MIEALLRYGITVLGYLSYALVVLVLLLWFLFPAESVRIWLQSQMNNRISNVQIDIDHLALAFPGQLVATGVHLSSEKKRQEMVMVNQVRVSPDWQKVFLLKKGFAYKVILLEGLVLGQGQWQPSGSVELEGKIQTLQLGQAKQLGLFLGRRINGELGGDFVCSVPGIQRSLIGCRGDFLVENGLFSLRQPVFGLKDIVYSSLSGNAVWQPGNLLVKQGKMQSALAEGEFDARLTMDKPFERSKIQVNGNLKLRPEFFQTITDGKTAAMVKGAIKDGALPFTMNGTLTEPGLKMAGISTIMENTQGLEP